MALRLNKTIPRTLSLLPPRSSPPLSSRLLSSRLLILRSGESPCKTVIKDTTFFIARSARNVAHNLIYKTFGKLNYVLTRFISLSHECLVILLVLQNSMQRGFFQNIKKYKNRNWFMDFCNFTPTPRYSYKSSYKSSCKSSVPSSLRERELINKFIYLI